MTLISDIETNGFLENLDRVHGVVIKDAATGESRGYADQPGHEPIANALDRLSKADEVVFHNGIKFDVPAIQKVYPQFKLAGKLTDTLVLSRLIYPDQLKQRDPLNVKRGRFPKSLIGSHGIEAWGYRLKLMKGDYSEAMAAKLRAEGITDKAEIARLTWAEWSPEMHSYMMQDAEVGHALWKHLTEKEFSQQAIELEHEFATITAMMERRGFAFDVAAAQQLYGELVKIRLDLSQKLAVTFPPKEVTETFVPKVNNKTRGYVKGVPFIKSKLVEFNPSSRQMIADRLRDMGWKPTEFTDSGQAKIDETILSRLPYPEAKLLAEHFLIEKRIGQLAEGDQAMLRLERKGRIHGSVNPCGTPTGRCTHSTPNVAQTPKVKTRFGKEFRALLMASAGMVLVGVDLAGIELRCLGHYMARYDGGAYARAVVEGKEEDGTDVHSLNAKALGLDPQGVYIVLGKQKGGRDLAKTFIYAFLYGAGGWKIGDIVGVTEDEIAQIIASAREGEMKRARNECEYQKLDPSDFNLALSIKGQRLKARFLKQTPALAKLIEAVKAKAKETGYLVGLDGRRIYVRSPHAALNSLLQTAGAVIAKQATVFAYRNLSTRGWVFGRDWALVAHIHDELQNEAKEDIADEVGQIIVQSMRDCGPYFKFRVPIDGTAKSRIKDKDGNDLGPARTWADTH